MQTPMNRKSATRLLLVQWSKFQNVSVKLEGSTLFTGINGSGKSTILDAVTYLITGNTQFNKAARTGTVRYWAMSGATRRATALPAIFVPARSSAILPWSLTIRWRALLWW